MVDLGKLLSIFVDRLKIHGITIDPTKVVLDSTIHRIHVAGDPAPTKNLAYKINVDDRPTIWFQDHKRGVSDSFSAAADLPDLSAEERRALQQEWRAKEEARLERLAKLHAERAEWCSSTFKAGLPAGGHSYLTAKGFSDAPTLRRAPRLKGTDLFPGSEARDLMDGLLVPLYAAYGAKTELTSLQVITPAGDKWFAGDAATAGSFHPIPGPDKSRVLVVEGYATGRSLSRVTGHPVACAMTANNMSAVVEKMAVQYPDREIVVMADDDRFTTTPVENPGVTFAKRAAQPRALRVLIPPFEATSKGTDWDDWLREGGAEDRLMAMLDPEAAIGQPEDEEAGLPEHHSGLGRTAEETRGSPAKVEFAEPGPSQSSLPNIPDLDLDAAGTFVMPRIEVEHAVAEDPETDARAALYSQDNAALRFSELHHDSMRYVAPWGRWMRWEGARWIHDEDGLVHDRVRKVCRAVADFARSDEDMHPKNRVAVSSMFGTANTISSVERLARHDRRHAASVNQWDQDPWLINTPGGIVDLRTGKISAPSPDRYMTKITSVSPRGECPTWISFLQEATGNDPELIEFLQRMAGYSLTGLTIEQKFFFFYGSGGNGKGTFLNTLTAIFNDYAKVASVDMLTETRGDRHPTELAALRGARMVTAQEVEEGRRWAEAKLKMLTGSDPITARFMRQDEFEFIPQLKLIIAGNHKPGLRNVDEAIRRRFLLIPFTVKPRVKDLMLGEKLMAESGGILRWCIEGCLKWQAGGLGEPASVHKATEEYFETEDRIGQWISDCCDVAVSFTCKSSDMYKSFKEWSEANGEFVISQKRWAQQMSSRGFESNRSSAGVVYRGITVSKDHGPDWHDQD